MLLLRPGWKAGNVMLYKCSLIGARLGSRTPLLAAVAYTRAASIDRDKKLMPIAEPRTIPETGYLGRDG